MENKELKIIKEQLESRSEEVQEIMGFIPNWLIRWGITVIFMTILTLLIGSWFFSYPEILTSSIVVTTKNPPASIIAKSSGKFENIFIKNGDKVKTGELLAIIENPCEYKNFIELKDLLKTINVKNNLNIQELENLNIKKSLKLGELQNHYELFIKAQQDYVYFIKNTLFRDQLNSLKNQLEKSKLLLTQSTDQRTIQKKELELFKIKYARSKKLISEGIISKEESDSSKGIFLQKEFSYSNAETKITNLEIQIEGIKRDIVNLKNKFEQDKKQLNLNLIKVYKTLAGEISSWEQRYVLKSSIDGIIVFTKYWNINQNVKTGDKVLSIIPQLKEKLIGRVLLPISGSGKVKVGQKVNIKFDSYPFMEYGMVRGVIIHRSRIPSEEKYILEVEFPEGLLTNYRKELNFDQEMKGIAEIITEDISLLERLFSNLRSILVN